MGKHGIRKTVISMTTAATLALTGIVVPQPERYAEAAQSLTPIKITNAEYGRLTLKKGSSFQIKAKAGKKTNASFTWKSSNKKVVSVSKKGKIKAIKNGKATITVSGKKLKKATLKVTVGTKVSKVRILRPVTYIAVGGKKTLKPQVLPENASTKDLSFTSANQKIAVVDSKGLLQGMKKGTTEITIKSTDGSNKKTKVTVKVADSEEAVRAADDFYESVNADIFKSADYDPDSSGRWNAFSVEEEHIKKNYDELMNSLSTQTYPEGSSEDTLAELYLTAKDTETRNKNQLSALSDYFNEIDKASDINEYMKVIGKLKKDGIGGIISADSTFDIIHSEIGKSILVISGLSPALSEVYYDNKDFADVVKGYEELMKKLLMASGESETDAEAHVSALVKLEKEMKIVDSDSESETNLNASLEEIIKSEQKNLPEYTREQLKDIFTNVDINSYLDAAGYEDKSVLYVYMPKQMNRINAYLKQENLDILKEYAKFRVLYRYAPYLTTDLYESYMDFEAIIDPDKKESIEDFADTTVTSFMGWDLSKVYVDRYTGKEVTKAKVTEMVNEIVNQYHKDIEGCTWMGEATKQEAIKKLENMTKNVCYPDDWTLYTLKSDLKSPAEGGNITENMKMIFQEEAKAKREELNATEVSTGWQMSPITVNACYAVFNNSINIPIAICSGSFYSDERSKAENYGSLGTIIGHEISHGFDPNGAKFDEKGAMRNWWSDEDSAKYAVIQKKVIDYFNEFEAIDGTGIYQDGACTIGENIADLAGISCSVKLVGNDKEARKEFFTSYGHLWAELATDEVVKQEYVESFNSHSKAKTRVVALVALLDEFHETYDVKKTDGMYVAPEDRIKIWY